MSKPQITKSKEMLRIIKEVNKKDKDKKRMVCNLKSNKSKPESLSNFSIIATKIFRV